MAEAAPMLSPTITCQASRSQGARANAEPSEPAKKEVAHHEHHPRTAPYIRGGVTELCTNGGAYQGDGHRKYGNARCQPKLVPTASMASLITELSNPKMRPPTAASMEIRTTRGCACCCFPCPGHALHLAAMLGLDFAEVEVD